MLKNILDNLLLWKRSTNYFTNLRYEEEFLVINFNDKNDKSYNFTYKKTNHPIKCFF